MKQLLLALAIGLTAMGCRDKEEPQADCGCNSPNTKFVEYSSTVNTNLSLTIFYEKSLSSYVISGKYTTSSGGFPFTSYICNEDILSPKIKNIRNTDRKLVVKSYSGYEREYCGFIIPESFFSHIYLKNIEVE